MFYFSIRITISQSFSFLSQIEYVEMKKRTFLLKPQGVSSCKTINGCQEVSLLRRKCVFGVIFFGKSYLSWNTFFRSQRNYVPRRFPYYSRAHFPCFGEILVDKGVLSLLAFKSFLYTFCVTDFSILWAWAN